MKIFFLTNEFVIQFDWLSSVSKMFLKQFQLFLLVLFFLNPIFVKTHEIRRDIGPNKNIFEVAFYKNSTKFLKGLFEASGNSKRFSLTCSIFKYDNSSITKLILSQENKNVSRILQRFVVIFNKKKKFF